MLEIIDLAKRYGPVAALDGATFRADPAASSASSAPTAPARPPRCAASSAWPGPTAARSAGTASPSTARPACGSATCPSSAACIRGCASPSSSATSPSSTACSGKAANAAAARWLERMGLADRAKSKLEELSHGNQQRIQLAVALAHDPELLVLDEPFSGLDPIGIATMTEVVQERAAAGVGVRLLEPPARPRRGRLRGRRHHRPRPDRGRRRDRRAQGRIRPPASRDRGRRLRRRVARRPRRPDRARARRRPGQAARRRSVDLDELLPLARAAGEVRTFAYQPPKLSELFMEAVTPDAAGPGGGAMSRWRSIWLVARREILERGRSRGFILSVLFTTAHRGRLVRRPGAPLRRTPTTPRSASSQPAPAALDADRRGDRRWRGPDDRPAPLPRPRRRPRRPSRPARSRPSSTCRPTSRRRARSSTRNRRTRSCRASSARPSSALRMNDVLTGTDVDQAALAAAQTPPGAVELDPQTDADRARFLVANIGAVLILVGIFSFGFTVLTGVVEEKQSRVVEVVLSTVRARDLLMGKVLGIGVLGHRPAGRVRRRRARRGPTHDRARPADHDARRDRAAGRLVHPRLHAVLDRARLPRRARVADGGGLQRLHPGHDGRDDQLLRGDLRGRQRPARDGRDHRHVHPAVGAVRRPAAGRVRCDRARGRSGCRSSSRWPRSGSCSRSGPGSTPAPSSRRPAG